jgi:hypothetical protein
MTELVEHLADLTALRDRDALDLALISAIVDILQPETAAICRLIGKVGDERWRICAQLVRGQSATSDSVWSKLDSARPTWTSNSLGRSFGFQLGICQKPHNAILA